VKIFHEDKNNLWLFICALLACFAVSSGVRYQQFETWEKTPTKFFVGERPMMTTLDAPYWLRLAREYNEGVFQQKDGLRGYPDSTRPFKTNFIPKKFQDPPISSSIPSLGRFENTVPTKTVLYYDVPLLSFLIAHFSPIFDNNYYLTGTLLIPMLASLFILPLGIYFFRIGVPVSGLLGGLIGTFASGYYMRSSIGRIDTDMLNLFFPVLAGLLILLAGKAKKERNVLLYSLGAGFSLFLFQWWYAKAGFTLAYFAVLMFSLFVLRVRLQTIFLSSLLFVLCVQPSTFMSGLDSVIGQIDNYIFIVEAPEVEIDIGTNPATFPNVMTTISEVDPVPMNEVLRRVLSNTTLDWIGFLGLFGLFVFKWRVLLPLMPMLGLGLLSFQSSNRFIMYLAPFIGIGLGWLLQLGIEGTLTLLQGISTEKTNKKGLATKGVKDGSSINHHKDIEDREFDLWNWGRQGGLYLGMGVFFWLISGQTAISFVPGPSIHTGIYATFFEVKKRVPVNAALLTWWDYGYAITDATGLATFHDGGEQQSPKTFFTARGLISADQDELYDITQYLATESNLGIAKNNTSPEELMNAVRNPTIKPWDPIYLFFTADMTGKYGAISKLGSWDIVEGGSKPRGYQNLACNKITNEEMNCSGAKIDLKAGKINNQVALKRMIFIRDGQVLREQSFGHAQGYTLQLLVAGNQIAEVQLIDEVVFRSNYNQMFLLGRYREDLYEETYNAFPFSRLYRVKF
jgi:undecaprenyl-diphosphooligosaccharide---protein glycotransferase